MESETGRFRQICSHVLGNIRQDALFVVHCFVKAGMAEPFGLPCRSK